MNFNELNSSDKKQIAFGFVLEFIRIISFWFGFGWTVMTVLETLGQAGTSIEVYNLWISFASISIAYWIRDWQMRKVANTLTKIADIYDNMGDGNNLNDIYDEPDSQNGDSA